jgi:hypothetical protein
MQNQEMPKQIAVTVMEGTRRRGRPGKTWRDEVGEAVNVSGVKKRAGNGQRPSRVEEGAVGCKGAIEEQKV